MERFALYSSLLISLLPLYSDISTTSATTVNTTSNDTVSPLLDQSTTSVTPLSSSTSISVTNSSTEATENVTVISIQRNVTTTLPSITTASGEASTGSNIAATTLTSTITSPPTGCSGPPVLCCPGQNNSCHRGCFCDEICVTLNDCCSDYKSTCPQLNSTTAPPLNVSMTSASTAPSPLSSISTDAPTTATMIVHLKASVLSHYDHKDTISALSSFFQTFFQRICNGCTATIRRIKPT